MSVEASEDNHHENQHSDNSHNGSISNEDIQSKANRINDKNRLSTKEYYTESARDNSHHENNEE